ncbi:hypothetical protein BPAE_0053g00020 [Botrytis paeoniae]|uniref:Uncharacterized protein n=1 Tax=Botrytis paeoniae TaxID=278948 RepID=A0A4Z1FV28_9HELO|nr:hypothetical protein BPAE_0053g00020 [Botrytis paeoniae]
MQDCGTTKQLGYSGTLLRDECTREARSLSWISYTSGERESPRLFWVVLQNNYAITDKKPKLD